MIQKQRNECVFDGARSHQALGVIPSRGDPCRGLAKHENLSRLGEPGPQQNFAEVVVGPGRPARGTLVSTVPTALEAGVVPLAIIH